MASHLQSVIPTCNLGIFQNQRECLYKDIDIIVFIHFANEQNDFTHIFFSILAEKDVTADQV